MDKYFKVPMAAARAIVDSSEGPDLLAAYMTQRRWSHGEGYEFTSGGAKSISKATGITDYRSKRLLSDLLALRFGERGELSLITPTGVSVGNGKQYAFGQWDGVVSYVPDLLIQGDDAPIKRLLQDSASDEVRRDALLMLLHAYATADYGEFLGIDPNEFVYVEWAGKGVTSVANSEIDLGYHGEVDGMHFWLMREEEQPVRYSTKRHMAAIYGDGDDAEKRFWAAHTLLTSIGMLCRVAMVYSGRETYPLWVFSPAYREALAKTGVVANLGWHMHRFADENDLNTDEYVIWEDAHGRSDDKGGAGLFFCATTSKQLPVIKTIYAPLFHAPTPDNLDGLAEMATRTKMWATRLKEAQ